MHIDIVNTIIYYTQNLGSNEDIVSGALATAFYYCPKYTESLFKWLEIKLPKLPKSPKDDEDDIVDDYFVDTGSVISGKKYKWLSKKIDFKPDILIYTKDEWSENKNDPPIEEELILIEAKLFGSRLKEEQEIKYKLFKQEFFERTNKKPKMLLITLTNEADKEKPELFDKTITWNELLEKSEDIFSKRKENESERIILKDIIEFITLQIIPEKDDLYTNKEICPYKILKQLIQIIRSKQLKENNPRIRVQNIKELKKVYTNEDDRKYIIQRFEKYGITRDKPMSLIKISGKDENFYINCTAIRGKALFWIDFDNSDEFIEIGTMDFKRDYWKNRWISIAEEINIIIHNNL